MMKRLLACLLILIPSLALGQPSGGVRVTNPTTAPLPVTLYKLDGSRHGDTVPLSVSQLFFRLTQSGSTALSNTWVNSFSIADYRTVAVAVTGTWSGTIRFQGSMDGGTNWFDYPVTNVSVPGSPSSAYQTENGIYMAQVNLQNFRYGTGTMNSGTVSFSSTSFQLSGDQSPNPVMLSSVVGGGLLISKNLDLNTTDVAVKATKGQLYGYMLHNAAANTRFFKLYNDTTANVTVGTTTPVLTIPIPAGSSANVDFAHGIEFTTAITAACTTGVADNNSGAPAANECIGNFFYK